MLRLISITLGALLLSGCAQKLLVTVDGYAAPDAPAPGTYYLASGTPRVSETDLQFRNFSTHLEQALGSRGWSRVAAQKDAGTLIRFRYGVTAPLNTVREYEMPEYGIVGYQSTFVNGGPTAAGYTVATPIYGRTGSSYHSTTRVTYGMNVVVEAYDLSHPGADGTPPQVWKTIFGTSDEKGDLRAMLPRLIASAAPSLGRDTKGVIEIEIPAEEKK